MNTKIFKKDKGVTLIELIVAIAIMSVGLIPIMQLFPFSMKINVSAQNAYKSTLVAKEIMTKLINPSIAEAGLISNLGNETSLNDSDYENIRWYASIDSITGKNDLKKVTLYVYYPRGNDLLGDSIITTAYRYNF